MRQSGALEEGHERGGKRLEAVTEGLQRPFATDGRAKQQRQKVEDLVATKPSPRQAHLSAEGFEKSLTAQIAGDKDNFGKPGGNRRLGSRRGVDVHTRMWYGAHDDLLAGNIEDMFPDTGGRCLACATRLLSLPLPSFYLVAHPVGRAQIRGAGHALDLNLECLNAVV
jgi:hypothetical protein